MGLAMALGKERSRLGRKEGRKEGRKGAGDEIGSGVCLRGTATSSQKKRCGGGGGVALYQM